MGLNQKNDIAWEVMEIWMVIADIDHDCGRDSDIDRKSRLLNEDLEKTKLNYNFGDFLIFPNEARK